MQWKLDRIVSLATLVTSVAALVLVLKRPQPVAAPMTPAAQAANAQSFENKLEQLDKAKGPGEPPAQVHLSADELRAALAEAAKSLPMTMPQASGKPSPSTAMPAGASSSSSSPVTSANLNALGLGNAPPAPGSSADAFFAPGDPDVKDYQLSFEGDVAKGQFLTTIGGKPVWVTLAGHLASKDGYATFDPTEFKVGDLDVPVSLVNDALQKKLSEQKDKLKLPDNVGGFKVENGEMVLTQR